MFSTSNQSNDQDVTYLISFVVKTPKILYLYLKIKGKTLRKKIKKSVQRTLIFAYILYMESF